MKTKITMAVFAVLIALLGVQSWRISDLEASAAEAEVARDSLAAQAAAERARARGWEVALRSNVDGLHRAIMESEDSLSILAEDLSASRVRIEQLTEMVVEARGSGQSVADTVYLEREDTAAAGRYDDGLLVAEWEYLYRVRTLRLDDYRCSVPLQMVSGRAGDGRLWFSARSPDDRVGVRVDSLVFDPPEPVVERRGPGWLWTVAVAAGSYLAGDLLPW